jgi:hypothetical protein
MSFLSGIGDLLKQYSANSATPAAAPAVEQHFDQVAQAVPSILCLSKAWGRLP